MSWLSNQLQNSLDTLKSQVASSLKDVFVADDEEDEELDTNLQNQAINPEERLKQAIWRIRELKDSNEQKKADLKNYKALNQELENQNKKNYEKSKKQCNQLKELLQDKESEINLLLHEKDELTKSLLNGHENEEVLLLRNQIESLQNCLAEVKIQHQKELSAIQNKPGKDNDLSHDFQSEILRLQSEWNQERSGYESEIMVLKNLHHDETLSLAKTNGVPQLSSEENELLTGEIDSLKVQLRSKIADLEQLEEKFKSEKSDWKEELQSVRTDAERHISSLISKVSQFESDKIESTCELERLKRIYDDEKENHLIQLQQTSLNHESQIEEFNQKINLLQSDNCNTASLLDTFKQQKSDEIAAFQELISKHKLDYERLQKEFIEITEEKKQTESQASNLQQRLDEALQTLGQNTSHQVEVESLRKSVESLSSELCDARNQQTSLSEELNDIRQILSEERTDHQHQLDMIKSSASSDREKEIYNLHRELENMRTEKEKLEKHISVLESNPDLNSLVERLESELRQNIYQKEEALNDKILLENECSTLKEKVDGLLKDYKQQKEEFQNIISNNQNSSQEMIEILEGSNQECDHLKTDLFKAQEEIKRLTKENDAFVAAERTKEDEKNNTVALNESLNSLTATINEERLQYQSMKESLESKLSREASEIERLESKVLELQASLSEKELSEKAFEKKLSNEKAELEQDIKKLQVDLDSKSAELSEVESKFRNKLHNLEEYHRNDEKKYLSLQSQYEKLSQEHKDLESNHMVVSEGAQQLESFRLEVSRLQADSEDLHKKLSEAEAQQLKLQIENDELHAKMESSKNESEEMNELKKKIEELKSDLDSCAEREKSWLSESQTLMAKLKDGYNHLQGADKKLEEMSEKNQSLSVKLEEKQHDLDMANRNIDHLKSLLEEKAAVSMSEQQLKTQSLAAIQEFQAQLTQSRRDRDQALSKVAQRDRELQEFKREVNVVIDKKRKLEQEVERLKQHLVSVEESSIQEAVANEEKEKELRKKLQITEEALRVASAQNTSAHKETTVHVQVLETRLNDMSQERDKLQARLRTLTEDHSRKMRSLENLEAALAGLQVEKKNEIRIVEQTYIEKLSKEESKRLQVENKLAELQQRVLETEKILSKADSLGEQITSKNQTISVLRQEIKIRDDLLQKAESEFGDKAVNNARFERNLVKNLIVSYFQADEKQKLEVLTLIAKVVGFNEEDRIKTGLDKPGYGMKYLRNMLPSRGGGDAPLDLSIAEAFVKFLETESTPKTPIRLPASEMAEEAARRSRQSSVSSTTPSLVDNDRSFNSSGSPNPLVMAANSTTTQMATLPTFSMNRSSSSILRHVLQEEQD